MRGDLGVVGAVGGLVDGQGPLVVGLAPARSPAPAARAEVVRVWRPRGGRAVGRLVDGQAPARGRPGPRELGPLEQVPPTRFSRRSGAARRPPARRSAWSAAASAWGNSWAQRGQVAGSFSCRWGSRRRPGRPPAPPSRRCSSGRGRSRTTAWTSRCTRRPVVVAVDQRVPVQARRPPPPGPAHRRAAAASSAGSRSGSAVSRLERDGLGGQERAQAQQRPAAGCPADRRPARRPAARWSPPSPGRRSARPRASSSPWSGGNRPRYSGQRHAGLFQVGGGLLQRQRQSPSSSASASRCLRPAAGAVRAGRRPPPPRCSRPP